MAGRPRTMLKRVSELALNADAYGASLYNLTPQLYLERPDPANPLSAAWNEALRSAASNLHAIRELRDLLAEKVARAEEVAAADTETACR